MLRGLFHNIIGYFVIKHWNYFENGSRVEMPSSIIFEESVRKIGKENSYIWHEINYIFSFDSDW